MRTRDERYLGDIYISPAYVQQQCERGDLDDEHATIETRMPVLLAHGLCHLLGCVMHIHGCLVTRLLVADDVHTWAGTTTKTTPTLSACNAPSRSFWIATSSSSCHMQQPRRQLQRRRREH